jgi:hypothetical protein
MNIQADVTLALTVLKTRKAATTGIRNCPGTEDSVSVSIRNYEK